MQFVTQSPSLRPQVRQFSTKRRRSPEPEEYLSLERPTKRLTLAIHTLNPALSLPQSAYPIAGATSSNSSRYPSEEWVQQAGGLRIDSPHISRSPSPLVPSPQLDEDEMAVDPREATYVWAPQSRTPLSNPTFIHLPAGPVPQSMSNYDQQQEQDKNSSSSSSLMLRLPTINILPSTPSDSNSRGSIGCEAAPTRPSSPDAASPMNVSISSMNWSMSSPASTKKNRTFTMGPRNDCEKCRLGTPGHYMHF